MASQADLVIAIRAMDQASAQLNNVAGSLGKVGQSAQSSAPGFLSMASAVGVGTLAAGGLMAAAGALVGGLQSAVKTSADFGQSMANIKATVPKAEFEQFGAQTQALAMRLGKDYPLSATEAGKAMEILAQKGISLKAINNGAAEAVVQLSAATGGDLATSAGIAAVAMDVFRVKEEDMGRVTDLMAGSMLRGGVSAKDFGYAVQSGGTAIALAGGTIDDASIAIAAMAKAGIEGSDAGTSLKTMYMNLIPTTKGQIAVARELGIITADGANQFFDASGKVKSYEEISGILATSLEGLTEKQKLSKLETLFGSDAIRAAAVSAQVGAGDFGNLGAAIREPGIAADAAKTKLDSLSGQMQQLSGSTETLALTVGNKLSPGLQKAAEVATEFVNGLIDMAANIDIAPAIDGVGNALSSLSTIVYDAGQAASSLGEVFGQLPVVGDLVDRGFQIVGSVLTALAAIMRGDGAGAAEALGQAFSDLGGWIETAVGIITTAVTTVSDGWTMLVDATTSAYDAVVSAVTTGWDAVTSAIDGAFAAIGGAVSAGWDWAVTAETQAAMANLIAAVGEAWTFVSSAIADAFGGIVAAVTSGWGQATGETQSAMAQIIGAVESVAGPIVAAVSGFMSSAVATVASFAGEAWSAAAGVAGNFVAGLRDGINSRVQEIAGAAQAMIRAALGAAQAAQESQSPSKATHKIGEDFVAGFIQAIEDGQMGEAVRVQVMDMIAAFDDYKIISGEIARVESEIKGIREDAAAAALERGREMIDLTSEELRLRQDLAYAERDLLPARRELRDVQREMRDAERGGLPTQERVIEINGEINRLKLIELGYDRQLIGVDRRSKEAEAVNAAKEAVNNNIRTLELEKREIQLGGQVAADAYRKRELAAKTVVEAGERELEMIQDVIKGIDAEQKIFQAHENVVKNATQNEINERQRLINVFKSELQPVQNRIAAGRQLIDTMFREGTISKEQYDALQNLITAETGNKNAVQAVTSARASAITSTENYKRATEQATGEVKTATTITDGLSQAMDILGNKRPNVVVTTNVPAVQSEANTFSGLLDLIGNKRPAPVISAPGLADVKQAATDLNTILDDVAHPVAIGFSANVPTAVTVTAINTATQTVTGAVNAASVGVTGGVSAAWAAVGGGLSVSGGANGNALSLSGNVSAGEITGGKVDVTGNIEGDGKVDVNGNIEGDGKVDVNGDVDADGKVDVNGDVDANGNVDVGGDVKASTLDAGAGDKLKEDIEETVEDDVDWKKIFSGFGGSSNFAANGGPVHRGGLTIVGEEGPELVAWGADGYVIPHGPSMQILGAGGGGGGGTLINVTVNVGGSVLTERELLNSFREELIRLGRTNGSIFGGYT